MRRLLTGCLLLWSLTFAPSFTAVHTVVGQAPAAPAPATRLDDAAARRLMQDVQALAAPEMEGRLTGTAGSRRAQAFIRERFTEIGLQPLKESFEQKFSFTRTRGQATQEFPDATNLIGLAAGRDRDQFVLVTAHYDHLGVRDGQTFHGADDNASGVAAMLAIAAWAVRNQPRRSVLFVAFDAEEHGLQGARHFVAHPPVELKRVTAVVNLDMVGRGDKNVLFVAGTHHHPQLKGTASDAIAAAAVPGLTVTFGHDRPGVAGVDDWTHSSDHGPFHDAGVPFLYFGVEDHADYHKPTDTADKIPHAFHAAATGVVLETVKRLSGLPAK